MPTTPSGSCRTQALAGWNRGSTRRRSGRIQRATLRRAWRIALTVGTISSNSVSVRERTPKSSEIACGERGLVAGDDGAQPLEPVAPQPRSAGGPCRDAACCRSKRRRASSSPATSLATILIGHGCVLPKARHSRSARPWHLLGFASLEHPSHQAPASRRAAMPIRIAIVGYGKIARDQHVPSIAADPRFELAAVVSPRAQAGRGRAGLPEPRGDARGDGGRARRGRDLHPAHRPARHRRRPLRGRPRRAAREAAGGDARRDRGDGAARPREPGAPCSPPGIRSMPPARRRREGGAGRQDGALARHPLARGRAQMASGPGMDLGAGRLRRVRSGHQRALDRDPDPAVAAVRARGHPRLPGEPADPDRGPHRLRRASGPFEADMDWRYSEGERWTIRVETEDGTARRAARRRRPPDRRRRAAARRLRSANIRRSTPASPS